MYFRCRLSNYFAGAVMFAASLPVNAALIGVQDHGTYFTDTQSGLDWLDVTASLNMSYNYVSSQFGSGDSFEGWRYATAAELGAMWDNVTGESAGITGPAMQSISERGTSIEEVINLVGDTLNTYYLGTFGQTYCERNSHIPTCYTSYTIGLLADPTINGGVYMGYIHNSDTHPDNIDEFRTTDYSTTTSSSGIRGSFLVRTSVSVPVPVPPVIGLLAIGLASLIISRRKLSSRQAQV